MDARLTVGWGIFAAVVLGAAAACLLWLGLSNPGAAGGQVAFGGGVLLGALALGAMTGAAVARARRDSIKRKLDAYSCRRCGYRPDPEQVESGSSLPCPRCGQNIYPA